MKSFPSFLISALSIMFLQRVQSAALKGALETRLDISSSTRTSFDGGSTVDEEEEGRARPIEGNEDQNNAEGSLGPWAIAGIVLGVVGAVAVVIVLGVAVDRRRKHARGNVFDDGYPYKAQLKKNRPIKYVPVHDESWRGPAPFEEAINLPDQRSVSASKEELEDDLTILELYS